MWAVLAIFLYLDWCRTYQLLSIYIHILTILLDKLQQYTDIFLQITWLNTVIIMTSFTSSPQVSPGELEMQDCNNVTVRSFSWSPGRGRDGLRGGYCPDCPMKQALVRLVSSETWIPQQHSIEIKQFHTSDVKQRKKVLIFCNKLMNLPSWLLAS